MSIDFDAKADEFIALVQAANITPSTDVVLVYHLLDVAGAPLPTVRISIVPTTTVRGFPTQGQNKAFAGSAHLASIIQNINSLLRNCPTTPFMMRESGNHVVTVQDIELEIT
jgi:hypothetical protein